MKKYLLVGAFVLALVAAFCAPKVFAESISTIPASFPTDAPERFVKIRRKITNLGTPISFRASYSIEPARDNPAPVENSSVYITTPELNATPDENNIGYVEYDLDLSGLVFKKVGDYGLVLTEENTAGSLDVLADETQFVLTAHVYNELDDNQVPTGKLLVRWSEFVVNQSTGDKVPFEEFAFESAAQLTYIKLSSMVTGSMADAEKYFKYQIVFDTSSHLDNEAKFTILGQDRFVEYDGKEIETESLMSADSMVVYLKHGQEATIGVRYERGSSDAIYEIPQQLSYSIENLDAEHDGYAIALDEVQYRSIEKVTAGIDAEDFASANVTVAKQSKEADVDTGVVLTTLPFAMVTLAGIGGFAIYKKLGSK